MAAPVITTRSTVLCPHGGQVRFVPMNTRLFVDGDPVVTVDDEAIVVGCATTAATGACIRVAWYPTGAGLAVDGHEVLTMATPGATLNGSELPTGEPAFATAAPRVMT